MGVRIATIDDVSEMSYIHSQTWKKAYVDFISAEHLEKISDEGWIPLFTRVLKENIHYMAVYETDRNVTGIIAFGKAGKEPSENAKQTGTAASSEGEIISLYVLPQYWSTGQGYELMNFAIGRLREQGCKSCFLWVIIDNDRAINFYRRFGFVSSGELMTAVFGGSAIVEEKYILQL